jgi:methionyl-tRNA formyltransferase
MRLAFLGTPAVAPPALRALVAEGHDIGIVVTQPDRKRGRGGTLVPSPVKAAALELGIPVTSKVDDVLAVDPLPELGVVVAFGRLIKPHVLTEVPMINIHFSLLPRWRGAAPVERAILAGDPTTGVCVMDVEEGLDTGGVYAVESTPIGEDETAEELRDRLTGIGTRLLVETLRSGLGRPTPQSGEPTYADKIDPAERHLDWSQSAVMCHRRVRIGRAWTTFRDRRLLVHRSHLEGSGPAPGTLADDLVVGCGDGRGLRLLDVQPEGKPPLLAADWARGYRPVPGERLG